MRGKLSISLDAIKANHQLLNQKTGNAICAAVVKANAYGLGIDAIAPALAQTGVQHFFVALLEEGMQLRQILPQAEIYVLNGIQQNEEKEFIEYNLVPVLNDKTQIAFWQNGKPCAVHVDTGLNRLGFNLVDLELAHGLQVDLVLSHLACADTPQNPINELQKSRFAKAALKFPKAKKSLAASDGIFCGNDFHFDVVRPGAALYGLNPMPGSANPMQRVVQLSVPILQTRTVDEDGFVGYAATAMVKKGQRLATISLGYADGFFRSLSNQGQLYYKGNRLPVLGRVSMDVVTVDISELAESELKPGDLVNVFNNDQSPDDLAKKAGTIGYEILTSLGNRFERLYI